MQFSISNLFFLSVKHFMGYWHPAFPISSRVYICDAAAVMLMCYFTMRLNGPMVNLLKIIHFS